MMPEDLPTNDNITDPNEVLCGLLNDLIDEYDYELFERCVLLVLDANLYRAKTRKD